jgi:hypothetical protein
MYMLRREQDDEVVRGEPTFGVFLATRVPGGMHLQGVATLLRVRLPSSLVTNACYPCACYPCLY